MGLCKDGAYDWIEVYFRDCVYRCGALGVIEHLCCYVSMVLSDQHDPQVYR